MNAFRTGTATAAFAARAAARASATATARRPFSSTPLNRIVHNIESNEAFHSTVAEQSKVIVDCFATWCGPCKAIAPILSKASDISPLKENVHFVKFDVDELAELARDLGVRAMPTFFFYKDGKKVDEMVGANPAELLRKLEVFATE